MTSDDEGGVEPRGKIYLPSVKTLKRRQCNGGLGLTVAKISRSLRCLPSITEAVGHTVRKYERYHVLRTTETYKVRSPRTPPQ